MCKLDALLQFYGQKQILISFYFLCFYQPNGLISWNAFNWQMSCFDVMGHINVKILLWTVKNHNQLTDDIAYEMCVNGRNKIILC